MSNALRLIDNHHDQEGVYSVPSSHKSLLRDVLQRVEAAISPVWPLKDYVAVNPYANLDEFDFLQARAHLREFSDCELLPSFEYFAEEYRQGRIDLGCLRQAISDAEFTSPYDSVEHAVRAIQDQLSALDGMGLIDIPQRRIAGPCTPHLGGPPRVDPSKLVPSDWPGGREVLCQLL